MQFERYTTHAPREVTPRMVAAYARSCAAKQAALPLLAPLIAETQLPVEDEMARRAVMRSAQERSDRAYRAAGWLNVRRRLFALPERARRIVLDRYHSSRWYPRKSGTLAAIIWSSLKDVRIAAEEVPPVADEVRLEALRALNDRARQGDPYTRSRRAYSPGALRFLAPGFEPTEDEPVARLNLHTSRGRWALLWHGVADFLDFSHNVDPTGERRAGVFDALGLTFRFEVFALNHCDDGEAVAPHLIDLSRRIVWVGLADEVADLSVATWTEGCVG